MRVQTSWISSVVVVVGIASGSAYAWAQSPVGTTGSYKGFTVTAVVKGKQESYNLDGVTTRFRRNHLVKVELRFDRSASTPADWSINRFRTAFISTQEITLRAPDGTAYPALIAPVYAGFGVTVVFDKTLAQGKGELYFEVPADTVCSATTLRLAESEFRFDQPKFPNSCH